MELPCALPCPFQASENPIVAKARRKYQELKSQGSILDDLKVFPTLIIPLLSLLLLMASHFFGHFIHLDAPAPGMLVGLQERDPTQHGVGEMQKKLWLC